MARRRRVFGLTLPYLIGLSITMALFAFISYSSWWVVAFSFCGSNGGCAKQNTFHYFLGWTFSMALLGMVPWTAWRGSKHPAWKWVFAVPAAVLTVWYLYFAIAA